MSREIGARIRAARKAAGLSQEKLAKSVEGLSASALGKAERGEKALSSEQLEAVARALGVPPETLLEDVEAEDVAAPSPAGERRAGDPDPRGAGVAGRLQSGQCRDEKGRCIRPEGRECRMLRTSWTFSPA